MKSGLKELFAELVKETAAAREKRAAEHLNLTTIREQIYKSARTGEFSFRIRLPEGVDVRGTKAGQALQDWGEKEGLRIVWETRACDMPDGRRVDIVEPVISWEPKMKK